MSLSPEQIRQGEGQEAVVKRVEHLGDQTRLHLTFKSHDLTTVTSAHRDDVGLDLRHLAARRLQVREAGGVQVDVVLRRIAHGEAAQRFRRVRVIGDRGDLLGGAGFADFLAAEGGQLLVLKLQGFIFFGTANNVLKPAKVPTGATVQVPIFIAVNVLTNYINNVALPDIDFRVVCSKGFYVRTYCHDIGAELGCGGHMAGLRRTRSGKCLACGNRT